MGQNSLTSENFCDSKNSGNHGPSARNNAAIFRRLYVPKNLGNCANPTSFKLMSVCKSDSNFWKCVFKKCLLEITALPITALYRKTGLGYVALGETALEHEQIRFKV